jgi:hypothetical protein
MQLSALERERSLARLAVIGVPKEISIPFVREIEKWIECSGVEWTITRLKSILTDLIRKRAGQGPSSSWVRKNFKRNVWFTGAVGGLEKWGFKGKNFPLLVQALRIYTIFYAGEVTTLQAKKFMSGVMSTPVDISTFVPTIALGLRKSGIKAGRLSKGQPLLARAPSETRGPTVNGTKPEADSLVDSVVFLHLDGKRHYNRFHELYDPILKGLESEILCEIPMESLSLDEFGWPFELVVGSIGIIQEPGYKLRAVANPGRVFQQVLKPLGDKLFSILSELPWDCTFEQSKADHDIQVHLDRGSVAYSVDLTGATDYFPLSLQIEMLSLLLPQDSLTINLFRELSTGWWMIRESIRRSSGMTDGLPGFTRWTKGQPLGLYPSFASFALTHGLLLLGLLEGPWSGQFYVLGDDVVILDEVLYRKYRVALMELGCPVSESKTLVSDRIAEFRSRIFEAERKHSIPQLKWRHPSDDSFLDVLRLLGYKGLSLLTHQQYKVGAIASIIPDFAGGLGFNPAGQPLEQRLEPWLELLYAKRVPVNRLTDYSSLLTERLQRSLLVNLAVEVLYHPAERHMDDVLRDLDQRSYGLVVDVLGAELAPLWRLLGRNLDVVLEGNLDLLCLNLPRRQTTLQKWESLLSSVFGDGWWDRIGHH